MTETQTQTPIQTPRPACVGDCDGSGVVTINELIKLVNIALGSLDISACVAGDSSGDGHITINEKFSFTLRVSPPRRIDHATPSRSTGLVPAPCSL